MWLFILFLFLFLYLLHNRKAPECFGVNMRYAVTRVGRRVDFICLHFFTVINYVSLTCLIVVEFEFGTQIPQVRKVNENIMTFHRYLASARKGAIQQKPKGLTKVLHFSQYDIGNTANKKNLAIDKCTKYRLLKSPFISSPPLVPLA